MSSEEDRVNNLVAEIRMLESAYGDIAQRQNFLERMLVDSRTAVETIKGIAAASSEDVLIPVGAGVLLRSAPPKVDKVLVNIGANVMVEKTRDEATSFMEARGKELEQSLVSLVSQRNQVGQRLESDRRALQSYINRQGQ